MSDGGGMELFLELFSGLPRQGPGDAECTARALSLLPPLGPGARILDIGSGTGAQTLELARLTPANIVAVDFHPPFIDELNASAARLGFASRVRGVVQDMHRLEFSGQRFDVLWCEGAIFIIGFDAGLEAWRELLRADGHLAVSELCWLKADPPRECCEWLVAEYPPVRSLTANREAIARAGYVLVGDFVVPTSAWWRDYYDPLQRNIDRFRDVHRGDPIANAVAKNVECEISMFRRYSDQYGYAFFVMRKGGD
jgi:ubiquinone/menaquinone biosynthesis C-methylase UbiE